MEPSGELKAKEWKLTDDLPSGYSKSSEHYFSGGVIESSGDYGEPEAKG